MPGNRCPTGVRDGILLMDSRSGADLERLMSCPSAAFQRRHISCVSHINSSRSVMTVGNSDGKHMITDYNAGYIPNIAKNPSISYGLYN